MCYRETRTVLWNPQDFLYTCDAHLTDPGFATAVEPEPTSGKVALSEEELNKIKNDWEESQRRKREKEANAAKEKEKEKEKEKDKGWLGWMSGGSNNASASTSSGDAATSSAKKTPPAALFASPNSTPAAHQKFILNRQIFAMRQTELRKKRQTSQVKALAPRLPGVPSNLS